MVVMALALCVCCEGEPVTDEQSVEKIDPTVFVPPIVDVKPKPDNTLAWRETDENTTKLIPVGGTAFDLDPGKACRLRADFVEDKVDYFMFLKEEEGNWLDVMQVQMRGVKTVEETTTELILTITKVEKPGASMDPPDYILDWHLEKNVDGITVSECDPFIPDSSLTSVPQEFDQLDKDKLKNMDTGETGVNLKLKTKR
jgi:hypothetical protein